MRRKTAKQLAGTVEELLYNYCCGRGTATAVFGNSYATGGVFEELLYNYCCGRGTAIEVEYLSEGRTLVSQYHFLAYMYRLRYIKRWSLMRNVVSENVAEHSYHVALLTHVLCTIGNEIYGRNYHTDRAVSMALFHDATEVFTGDIPTPVKHQNKDILTHFREIEHTAAHKLLDMIPDELVSAYRQMIGGPQSSEENNEQEQQLKKIIKAADQLDAYIKCITELSAGNKEFTVAMHQIAQALKQMNLKEIDYFLEHLAPSLEKTLDELSD